jgi:hypothetical protein
VTEREARQRASDISAMFGVSNIWDETRFDTRCAGLIQGHWEFFLSHRLNGYPTTHPLTIMIADLPGAPLYCWSASIDWEEKDIPTNVVLTAKQARLKSEEYVKKYFPLRDMICELTYTTNRLEYVSPNYNYIRPAPGTEGFSYQVSQKPELNLVYKCYFAKPDPDKQGILPVIIYVDAATGEMLGGW